MKIQIHSLFTLLFIVAIANILSAQSISLLPDSTIGAFNSELSGESAKRNLEFITRLHRMRGSSEFKKAVDFTELWELEQSGTTWQRKNRIADWESMPITLAEDSESGEATAELVDVGAGTSEKDYEGKDVKGKIVLTSASPSSVVALAIGK